MVTQVSLHSLIVSIKSSFCKSCKKDVLLLKTSFYFCEDNNCLCYTEDKRTNFYPAQQDNFPTSWSNVNAASFSPSDIVKYGASVSRRSSIVKPNLTASVAA